MIKLIINMIAMLMRVLRHMRPRIWSKRAYMHGHGKGVYKYKNEVDSYIKSYG